MKTSRLRIPREAFGGLIPAENGDFELVLRAGFCVDDCLGQPSRIGSFATLFGVELLDDQSARYGDIVTSLTPYQYRILEAAIAGNGRVTVNGLRKPVWGEHDPLAVSAAAIRTQVRRTIQGLAALGFPLGLSRFHNGEARIFGTTPRL